MNFNNDPTGGMCVFQTIKEIPSVCHGRPAVFFQKLNVHLAFNTFTNSINHELIHHLIPLDSFLDYPLNFIYII